MADPVHDYLAEIGRKGGAAGRGPAKARTSEQARRAALARWGKRKARAKPKLLFVVSLSTIINISNNGIGVNSNLRFFINIFCDQLGTGIARLKPCQPTLFDYSKHLL